MPENTTSESTPALDPTGGRMLENFTGRIRNTDLPNSAGLMPLFEAVVNSIHATEKVHSDSESGRIEIVIEREPESSQGVLVANGSKTRGPEPLRPIKNISIQDDGVGFNDENLISFCTLDTDHKIDKGCRGVGRLVWLKAFQHVAIRSVFEDGSGDKWQRKFTFDAKQGVDNFHLEKVDANEKTGSTVRLSNFQNKYRKSVKKSIEGIASNLLEHILWYFIRPQSRPEIALRDSEKFTSLDQVYEDFMHEQSSSDSVRIDEHEFELTHVKIKAAPATSHAVAYCADTRLVKVEKIDSKISGLNDNISDGNGQFRYQCYVSSSFLDQNARSNRTGFDIEEDTPELYDGTTSTMGQIRKSVLAKAEQFLSDELTVSRAKIAERVQTFVQTTGVRYRPILHQLDNTKLSIGPNSSDKELDLALHKELAEIESQLLEDGHDLSQLAIEDYNDEYQSLMDSYLRRAGQLKMSDLAGYVSHRHVILDLLQKAIRRRDDGSYAKEELIHNLIMPMGTDSNESSQSSNLWLIDDRLAFHDYLASDKSITSIPATSAKGGKEPDLLSLKVTDNPLLVSDIEQPPLASIVVVEIKRPMRADSAPGIRRDPVEQSVDYLKRIRNGEVKTATGRLIPQSPDIPGFCYIVADLTKSLRDRCETHHDLKPTQDHLGYFGYKENVKAYVEVISYDRLYAMAVQRNRAFFDRLGLPSR